MKDETLSLWPELEWIEDAELREATARTWERALEESPLTAADLQPEARRPFFVSSRRREFTVRSGGAARSICG